MVSADYPIEALGLERQRDHRAQASIAQNRDSFRRLDSYLLEYFIGSGERLAHDRDVVRHAVGDRQEIFVGKGDVVSESAAAAEDSEHGTVRAMTAEPRAA